jgi:hypothetical protein
MFDPFSNTDEESRFEKAPVGFHLEQGLINWDYSNRDNSTPFGLLQ